MVCELNVSKDVSGVGTSAKAQMVIREGHRGGRAPGRAITQERRPWPHSVRTIQGNRLRLECYLEEVAPVLCVASPRNVLVDILELTYCDGAELRLRDDAASFTVV